MNNNNRQSEDATMDQASEKAKITKKSNTRIPGRSVGNKIKSIATNKKVQLVVAIVLTLTLVIGYPVYSWFKFQRRIERYEKISTPNSLYITAARREDSKCIEVNNVDVSAYWHKRDGSTAGKASYQDYVFSVAGDYVTTYTLQLAHTTNNNYTYEIFQATATATDPSTLDENKALGKDFVEYTLSGKYDPTILEEIDPGFPSADPGDTLYYSVKKADDGTTAVSLNAVNPTISLESSLTASTYMVDGDSVSYKGHYLNYAGKFQALGTGKYHDDTYGSTATVGMGSGTTVQTHAEPLYWQARGIEVAGAETRDPFYHQYILRVSWENGSGADAASTTYKDTDIIYITVKAD